MVRTAGEEPELVHWLLRGAAMTAAALTLSCSGSTTSGPDPSGSLRVLFIGNSLTQFNDLPEMVRALSDSAGGQPIRVGEVTFGGFSLQDHWHQGDALEAIDSRRWDVVVMQQGPSSLDESRAELIDWAGRFATRIRAAGGRPALYQVWPMDYRLDVFDRILESYRLAAEGVQGELLPAGAAWAAAWENNPGLPLYGSDGFHPSAMGSYLAALAIYGELLDVSTAGLPSRLAAVGGTSVLVNIPPAQAAALQAAADEATGAP
jgi:hypothetical protein